MINRISGSLLNSYKVLGVLTRNYERDPERYRNLCLWAGLELHFIKLLYFRSDSCVDPYPKRYGGESSSHPYQSTNFKMKIKIYQLS